MIKFVLSQDIPITSNGKLRFHVDYAGFKGQENKTYQEFYLMLYANDLTAISKGDDSIYVFHVAGEVVDENDIRVTSNSWKTEAVIPKDSLVEPNLAIYDQWGVHLEPGRFRIHILVSDANSQINGEIDQWIDVASFEGLKPNSSQLEFVSNVQKIENMSHFKKGNKNVIPNPTRRYGVLNPTLYFYYELYHIPKIDDGYLWVDYSILDTNGNRIKSYPRKKITQTGENLSILHGLNVLQVSSGIYSLSVHISNSMDEKIFQLIRQFEILQADYFQTHPIITSEQANISGRLIQYIASPMDFKIFKSLSLSGKTKFLINFWKDRDTTPETLENEFLEAVKQRYLFSNDNFSWGSVEGWATDRGRVLIQYGMPEETDRYYFEDETHPYEVWRFLRQRFYEFVFADLQSNGNFILLHSTIEGEIHNEQWKTLIKRL